MRTVALRGPDHEVLGEVATAAAGPGRALGLSRGHLLKTYAYTDPNEDVVAVGVDGDRTLLVLADGHHGREASVAAVDSVLAQLDPLPDRLDADAGREVLRRAGDDVRAVTGASPHPGSRTTLVTALLAGTTLWWAALGDSALFVVDPSGVRRVDRPSHHFVGHAMARRDLRRAASVGREELGAGAWVVAVSDGFTDFARPSPEKAIAEAFPGEDLSPEAVAGRLVRAAFRGGAGDNVAVAVAAPATPDEGAPPTSAARTPDSAARRSA